MERAGYGSKEKVHMLQMETCCVPAGIWNGHGKFLGGECKEYK
jgi:hypothetical protein